MARVALVQMVSSANVIDNLQQVEKLMLQARGDEAQLVVLPENFAFMGWNETDKLQVAEVYGRGVIQEKISQLAKQLGLWVVAGLFLCKVGVLKLGPVVLFMMIKACVLHVMIKFIYLMWVSRHRKLIKNLRQLSLVRPCRCGYSCWKNRFNRLL